MSLFDSASLICTPNGYKAGKLYSIKPTSGAGDLDVVRATSATRVNANGLIEIPRTNLFTNSDGNLSTYTTNSNVTDATTPINNFTNSIQFGDNSLSRLAYKRNFTPTIGIQYTLSVFVQMDDNSLPVLGTTNSTGDFGIIINANLATINPKIEQLGTTNIYRVSVSRVADSTNTQFGVVKYTTQSLKGFKITGIQLEIGNVATEYIPTTSVIRTRFAGITQDGGSANNIPRLDYTNASCPSILVEPQRTNLLLRSEEFDNAYWSKSNLTITANAETSPDGYNNADAFVESTDSVNTNHQVVRGGFSFTSGTSYTFSIFVKPNSSRSLRLAFSSAIFGTNSTFFDLQNKSVLSQTGGTASIVEYSNGYLRCSFTATATSTGSGDIFFNSANGTTRDYIGNGTTCFYLYGAQLEAGSNATSYIPTVASTVTRNADVISKSGISSLIGQTEGTVFAEVDWKSRTSVDSRIIISIQDGATANRISIGFGGTNQNQITAVAVNSSGVVAISQANLGQFPEGITKISAAYNASGIQLFVNGTAIALGALSGIYPSLNVIGLGNRNSSFFLDDRIRAAALFPTRLDNATLQQLTTL